MREVVELTFDHLQQREEHWAIVDLFGKGGHIQHMQKTLDQTNLQIYDVLSEIAGLSGLRILDAILAGENVIRWNWRSSAMGESSK